ncbi:MAG: hypothetical protein VYA86_00955 [Candidatus Thermoplasmatota archaeon]|nr:hypothetical protein [Candidatus Thermoplasmatota archaeon]
MASIKPSFLLGEVGWYGSLGIPAKLPHEAEAPDSWKGWRRQRLKPAITGFLFPSAWSIFFLAAGSIPLFLDAIGSGIGMSNNLALGLWFTAFLLLWFGAIQASMQQTEGSVAKMVVWIFVRIESLLLAVLGWVFHNHPSNSIVLIGLLISIPLWLSYLVRIATVLAWPAGRWLIPIAHVNIGLSSLENGWVAESKRWARRPLARRKIEAGEVGDTRMELVLYGVRHENHDFVAIHFVHPSGVIMDPFVRKPVGSDVPFSRLGPIFSDVPHVTGSWTILDTPPVSPVIADWPSEMIPPWESEEE